MLNGYCDVLKPFLIKESEESDLKSMKIVDENLHVIRKRPLLGLGNSALVQNVERVGLNFAVKAEKRGEILVSDSDESEEDESNNTTPDNNPTPKKMPSELRKKMKKQVTYDNLTPELTDDYAKKYPELRKKSSGEI